MKKITLEFELDHCPFCGEEDHLEIVELDPGEFELQCNACACSGPRAHSFNEAAEKWNQRLLPVSVKRGN